MAALAELAELAKALQVLGKFQEENKKLAAQLETEKPAAQDKSKRTVAQGGKPKKPTAQDKSKKPAAQGRIFVPIPRVTTFCPHWETVQDVQDALLELGIPVYEVRPLLRAKEGSWLIFLDVRADYTKGTSNAEWLTAVCKGLPSGNIEDGSWTWKFRVFKDDQAHAELWRNGKFPEEAPASKEPASEEPASEEPASKEQTSKEKASEEQTSEEQTSEKQDVNALVASGKWGDAEEYA